MAEIQHDPGHDSGHDTQHDPGHDSGHDTQHDTGHDTQHDPGHDPRHIAEAAGALRRALGGLEPSVYGAGDAAALAEVLSLTEKACAAARLLLA
ncbi:MAG: hypothetical protein M0Z40_02610, partial [Actinomycetota bacterium]|nr:hypothetical protein [Actinomycetota bacterium]